MKTNGLPFTATPDHSFLATNSGAELAQDLERCTNPTCQKALSVHHGGLTTHLVQRELESLSAHDREILFLCVAAQLRYEKIAAILSLPVETVRQRVVHAREKLRARLFSK